MVLDYLSMIILTDLKQLSHYIFTDKSGAASFLGVNVKTLSKAISKDQFIKQYYITDQQPVKSKRGKK